jgi:UbiD family decarboxylase
MTMVVQVEATTGAKPRWRDLREWLERVQAVGELKDVRGATSEEDIGAITEMVDHAADSPAVLFDEIPGFEPGYRVLVNGMGSRKRQAITLGLDPAQASHDRLLDYWRGLLRGFAPVPPVTVARGAIQENILRDAEIDLTRFPAPIWHPRDGGRYIGTASVNITRDPDTGSINAGSYRNQVFDRNSVGIRVAPPHHGGIIKEKYFQRGEPCPVVVVVGADPLLFMASCVEGLRFGESELGWAGGVRGQPVEVIEGELTGLPIPAHAEIALEGYILPDEFRKEGPYGEWMGYYQDGYERDNVVRIHRIYHRNNPIILGSPPCKPPSELTSYRALMRSALIHEQLERAGVPDVQAVWTPEAGGTRLLIAVAIKQRYPGHARQAGHIAAMCHAGAYLGRYVIVVDEDVDVTDLNDVVWAMCTRADPEQSMDIIKRAWSGPLDPIIKTERKGFNSRMIVDACRPFEWRNEFPAVAEASVELMDKTRAKWGDLILGPAPVASGVR